VLPVRDLWKLPAICAPMPASVIGEPLIFSYPYILISLMLDDVLDPFLDAILRYTKVGVQHTVLQSQCNDQPWMMELIAHESLRLSPLPAPLSGRVA
jgi:hypothetical protein